MADNVTPLPDRGKTWHGPNKTLGTGADTYGQTVNLEGATKVFDDLDSSKTGMGSFQKRSNRQTKCVLVRNVSGIAIAPKRLVKWASGFIGKRVDSYAETEANENVAGVVDEFLPSAGCRDEDLCWIAVSGPTLVQTSSAADVGNNITAGNWLYAATAATSQAGTAGRVEAYAQTSQVTAASSRQLGIIGSAISAATTNQTNTDLLVDLRIMKGS